MGHLTRKHLALFAGLGGFLVAAKRNGIDTMFATDLEDGCTRTIETSFPGTTCVNEDISKLYFENYFDLDTNVDLLSAGFPCQSFSNAGNNLGFDDPRGKLFFEIPRLIKSLEAPPKVVLLENVAHLKLFDGGSRLNLIIQEMRMLGYWLSSAQSLVLDSSKISGSPQRRERLYMIAYHSDYFKKNLFDFENFRSIPANDVWSIVTREVEQDASLYLDKGNKYFQMLDQAIAKGGTRSLYQIRRVGVRKCPPNICPTLTANMGGGGHNVPFLKDSFGIRKLSITECLRLQGYADGEIIFPENLSNGRKYTMIGNAIHAGAVEKIVKQIQFN